MSSYLSDLSQEFPVSDQHLSDEKIARTRRRSRLIMLLDAAERAAIAPLSSGRLHAFAYLADVLSPVWSLPAFDGIILRIEGGPHYPDLQEELDHLVVLGLIEISNLSYVGRGEGGARIEGEYGLNFASKHLNMLLGALGGGEREAVLDEDDYRVHSFLVELAGALASIPNDEIDKATSKDVTYRSAGVGENVVDFAAWTLDPWGSNPTWRTADRFKQFLPEEATLTDGEKLYLYATYLGQVVNA